MHKIIQGFGRWYVTSYKERCGWDTVDFQCETQDEATAYCDARGLPYKLFLWADRGAPEPDFGQDYASNAEKNAAYMYHGA